jgi:hypothetical protein
MCRTFEHINPSVIDRRCVTRSSSGLWIIYLIWREILCIDSTTSPRIAFWKNQTPEFVLRRFCTPPMSGLMSWISVLSPSVCQRARPVPQPALRLLCQTGPPMTSERRECWDLTVRKKPLEVRLFREDQCMIRTRRSRDSFSTWEINLAPGTTWPHRGHWIT